jgi:hypothetical protein
MYRTCLFCAHDLGANETIEHFQVGRRLAFDAAKGRLWVVCRSCERWNLTALEERWEALEECERLFRDTKLRVSTEHIGLARVGDGLDLVRIGDPQRPEMAAWRYGDQFGRRRRAIAGKAALGAVAVGGVLVAGPLMGVLSFGGLTTWHLAWRGYGLYRAKRVRAHIDTAGARHVPVTIAQLADTLLSWRQHEERWVLQIPRGLRPWDERLFAEIDDPRQHYELMTLKGDVAERAMRQLLPHINAIGGSRDDVSDAVRVIEHTPEVGRLIRNTAKHHGSGLHSRDPIRLAKLPIHLRLALEMSLHEDSERRALEGELHLLEQAWRDADEVAAIADDMLLPEQVNDRLARLRATHDDDGSPSARADSPPAAG